MIAKIMKGSDFKGVVYYILNDGKGTQIIDSDCLFLENNDTIAQGFTGQARMNPRVTKAVGHIALSFSKEDEPRLDNASLVRIAREYMEKMGIRNTQYIIGRHFDKEHPHVHIAYNRIDNNGKTISDRNDRFRSERICKELIHIYLSFVSHYIYATVFLRGEISNPVGNGETCLFHARPLFAPERKRFLSYCNPEGGRALCPHPPG